MVVDCRWVWVCGVGEPGPEFEPLALVGLVVELLLVGGVNTPNF